MYHAAMASSPREEVQTISIVIPVYRGAKTLPPLLKEIEPLTHPQTIEPHTFQVTEVILVHDGAIDNSATVIQELSNVYAFIRPIWLSRNFGQHPATLAGMASTSGEWVVTIDEDGQQNPRDIALLLHRALEVGSQLVYASPRNTPPHSWFRNAMSSITKWVFTTILGNTHIGSFNSFRLIDGEIARSLAAYCGNSIYLDVALSWVVAHAEHVPVTLRPTANRRSGYSLGSLLDHFWRLILTSGTKPLRFITLVGLFSIVVALTLTAYAIWLKFVQGLPVQGWASLLTVVSFFSGCILFSLGVIAEYLAVALNIVMGKPLYLVTSRPPNTTKK